RQRGFKVALCGEGADELFCGYAKYRRAAMPGPLARKPSHRGIFGADLHAVNEQWRIAIDQLEADQRNLSASLLRSTQRSDLLDRLPNWLLIKLDRMLMAHGVEGRTPYLDRRVAAFAMGLPDQLKANPLYGKQLLRDWLAANFPAARAYAKKKGFSVPLGNWM